MLFLEQTLNKLEVSRRDIPNYAQSNKRGLQTLGWTTDLVGGAVAGIVLAAGLVWGTPPLALNGGSGTDTVSGFVCLAVHTASQSDSSFVKRHENIMSLVWPDQSDSRFTAGSLSLIVCVCRHITQSAFQIDRSTTASVPDSNFPVESLATRDYSWVWYTWSAHAWPYPTLYI